VFTRHAPACRRLIHPHRALAPLTPSDSVPTATKGGEPQAMSKRVLPVVTLHGNRALGVGGVRCRGDHDHNLGPNRPPEAARRESAATPTTCNTPTCDADYSHAVARRSTRPTTRRTAAATVRATPPSSARRARPEHPRPRRATGRERVRRRSNRVQREPPTGMKTPGQDSQRVHGDSSSARAAATTSPADTRHRAVEEVPARAPVAGSV